MERIALSKAALLIRRRDNVLRSWCRELGIKVEMIPHGLRYIRYITAPDFDRLSDFSDRMPRQKSPPCGRVWDAEKDYRTPAQRERDAKLDRRIAAASRFKVRCFGLWEVTEAAIQAELLAMASQ